jgi:hypothetical protein
MPRSAQVFNVLVAGPRDTADEVTAVRRTIDGFTAEIDGTHVITRSLHWSTDTSPELGADAQSIIDEQMVSEADILVGIFKDRLGWPTPRAASGTAEEIDVVHHAGKPVHVYLSSQPIPRDHDREQFAALDGFKADIQKLGLVGQYSSIHDLTDQVRRALERDVRNFMQRASKRSTAPLPAGQHINARGGEGSATTSPQNLKDSPGTRLLGVTLPQSAPGSDAFAADMFVPEASMTDDPTRAFVTIINRQGRPIDRISVDAVTDLDGRALDIGERQAERIPPGHGFKTAVVGVSPETPGLILRVSWFVDGQPIQRQIVFGDDRLPMFVNRQ